MKKICKFVMLLSIMLLSVSQMAWAESDVEMPDFAKASAKVSTKSNGKGTVYIYSQQSIDWPMACVMLNGSESIESCGFTGNPEDISLENAVQSPREEDVTADMAENSVNDKEIVGLYNLIGGIGTAPTICAKFMAFPANGYYLKGWSKTDNDFDLGGGTLEQCILTEARVVPILGTGGNSSDLMSMLAGVNIPDPSEYPDFGTYYATFAPVQINGCTAGNIAYMAPGDEGTSFGEDGIIFSTSYANHAKDFATPKLVMTIDGVKHYSDENGELNVDGLGKFYIEMPPADVNIYIDDNYNPIEPGQTFGEMGYTTLYSQRTYNPSNGETAEHFSCVDEEPVEGGHYYSRCIEKKDIDVFINGTFYSYESGKTFAEFQWGQMYTQRTYNPDHDETAEQFSCLSQYPEDGHYYYTDCMNINDYEEEPEIEEPSYYQGVYFNSSTGDANVYVDFEPARDGENNPIEIPVGEYKLQLIFSSKGGESSITAMLKLVVEEAIEEEAYLMIGDAEPQAMSLADAITAVNGYSGDAEPIIQMMNDFGGGISSPFVIARSCTLDLNGNHIEFNTLPAFFIVCNDATLTIMDSKEDGLLSMERMLGYEYNEFGSPIVSNHVFAVVAGYPSASSAFGVSGITDNGRVVLKSGTIKGYQTGATEYPDFAYGAGAVAVMTSGSSFVMDGGSLEASSDYAIACAAANMGGTMTIKGGTIDVEAPAMAVGVWDMAGTLDMTSGEVNIHGCMTKSWGVVVGNQYEGEYTEPIISTIANLQNVKISLVSESAINDALYGVAVMPGCTLNLLDKARVSVDVTTESEFEYLPGISAIWADYEAIVYINGAKLSTRLNGNYSKEVLEYAQWNEVEASMRPSIVIDAVFTASCSYLDTYSKTDEQKVFVLGAGKEFIEGYRYFLGTKEKAQMNNVPVCKIGTNAFATLEDAFLYAQNNPSVTAPIIMLQDYTLPAGYYTLPANATLLVPYAASQSLPMKGNVIKLPFEPNNGGYEHPYPYCKLTLASGVHIDAHGSIEASCKQFINGRADQGDAVPTGAYGWIYMEEGSEILLGDGAHLYAWGFVTGKGTIDARRGSYVHEDFQVYDWPGATDALNVVLGAVASGAGTFPVNQYAMQNVESQITFRPGARMYASFGASAAFGDAGIQIAADAIQIVGVSNGEDDTDVAMFLLDDKADADNTWVRKHYDAENDQQVWEVNSAAHLGSMNIEIPAFQMASFILGDIRGFDTRNFVLPITSNMKLHLLSGYMDITQNTEFLPGAEMEVDKTALLTIFNTDNDPSDGRVIFMDDDDWKDGYGCVTPYHEIRYSPTFDATLGSTLGDGNGRPNVRNLTREEGSDKKEVGDAKLNVHGTFDVNGYLLTSAGGATIFSNNEDAGTINYTTAVSEIPTINKVMVGFNRDGFPLDENIATLTYNMRFWCDWDRGNERIRDFADRTLYVRHNNKESEYTGASSEEIDLYPASLKNNVKTPEFAETGSDSDPVLEGESYCFVSNRWTKMTQFDVRFVYNNYNEWYIKPSEYVAIATQSKDESGDYADATTTTQPLENADHTYSDAAGEGRLFIWVGASSDGTPGQWWEVTLEDNLYKGKNGIYYYCQDDYDEDSDEHTYTWVEKTFEIKFLNWDGSPIMDANDNELEYTLHYGDAVFYNSTNPTRENTVDYTYTFNGWSPEITADSKVTGDATYTAQFTETKRKYTITFLNENGTEIERHFLTRDEIPVCEDVPTKAGNYLQWEPTISAVVGDQEYRATFLPEPPTEFTVTFLNNDGSEIYTYENVAKGTKVNTIYDQAEPAKADVDKSEYNWTFAGWMPAIDDEMEVEDNMTFIAQYEKAKKTCNVIFEDENGVVLQSATAYEYGQVPVVPEYTKPATAQYTYIVTWPGLQAVTLQQIQAGEDIVYKANVEAVTNKYTVTINATGCAVSGAGIYDYDAEVTLSLVVLNGYKSPTWSDGTTADKTITVTGDVTYTASAVIDEENEQYLAIDLSGSATDVELDKVTKVASFNVVAGEGVTTTPQLFGAAYIEMLKGANVTFTYNFGTADKLNWYAFAVPFKCDAQTATSANGSILRNTHEYDIVEYDGAIRAAQGPVDACWKYVSGILYPGKLYMIIFNKDQTTITFTGKDNGTYYYDNVASVEEYPLNGGDSNGNGWNGIANPALYRATLATGAENAEEYVNGVYRPVDLSDALAIAKPVFVQATVTQPVVVEAPSSAPVAARRTAAATTDRYVLNFGQDRVFLINDETAEDEYVTGKDLAKFGVSTKAAQIWVNRYGTQLCVNHQAAEWGETTYPLGVFAPKTDSYTFSINNANNSKQAWMLEDGIPVWNFAYGDYTCDITKGTTLSYSICIRQTPTISTPVENVEATTGTAEKVLINGVLYIVRDKTTYNAAGEKIK